MVIMAMIVVLVARVGYGRKGVAIIIAATYIAIVGTV